MKYVALAILLLPAAGFVGSTAAADCGSIPFESPITLMGELDLKSLAAGEKNIEFEPMDVVVYEPGQRAIILWNGAEEILLLSTDIRTSEPVSILEVIPFPNEPGVSLGEFETFEKMQKLLIDKSMWTVASGGGVAGVEPPASAYEVTFHARMGAHDLAVVHVLHKEMFLEWVESFLVQKNASSADIDPELVKIIGNYIERGYSWFVFDSLSTADSVQSRQPIEYRFKTDQLYYPLEISSRESGKTKVELLLVTSQRLEQFPTVRFAMDKEAPVTLAPEELHAVHAHWAQFMNSATLSMQRVTLNGRLRKMTQDFIAR